MDKPRILVVDDEEYTCTVMKRLLSKKGYDVLIARNGYEAVSVCKREDVDLALLDQRMPGISGIETLKEIKRINPAISVVMMTGYATVEEAVKAMKLGAYTYLTKPFDNIEEVEVIIDNALREKSLKDENRYLKSQLHDSFSFKGIIGKSKGVSKVIELVKKVAPLDSTILLYGETGTGKELIARTIHQNSSRAGKKFIALNCGAIPESLLESSLFGYEKGAFTGAVRTTPGYFEEANGGTLFLDEITDTSPKLQSSLLRVLQEREFFRIGGTERIKTDFRLIAATNCDIEGMVKKGTFREDLYYRINVIPINIPPLRERKEDIRFLANHFLEKFNNKMGKRAGPFSFEAINILEEAEWKGNVRELENTVERVVALKGEGAVESWDLPSNVTSSKPQASHPSYSELPYQNAKENFEKRYLEELLIKTGHNISKIAQDSGIPRQNLYLKLKKYGLR
ncbi:MAG TPA: sigma-54 dependent transcriptional regulator [Thermodesulfobacteriota bacterium]|nr:sigma-54 dependent transcriptional regulator [Thermodesulfobacteriota bacterium]